MKTTGVVRRIDNLGRIVIPKEIRKSIKITEGDSLEIYIDLDNIVLKKFSLIDGKNLFFQRIIDSYNKEYKKELIITNKNTIVNASLGLSNYLNKELSDDIKNIIIERKSKVGRGIIIDKLVNYYVLPLIIDSDAVGSLILIDDNITDNDIGVLNLLKTILIKNIEE